MIKLGCIEVDRKFQFGYSSSAGLFRGAISTVQAAPYLQRGEAGISVPLCGQCPEQLQVSQLGKNLICFICLFPKFIVFTTFLLFYFYSFFFFFL